jgi:hypothetical protein
VLTEMERAQAFVGSSVLTIGSVLTEMEERANGDGACASFCGEQRANDRERANDAS